MMAHDHFFSLLCQMSHGYESLAKARRTLRDHSAHRARVTPRVTSLMIAEDPQPRTALIPRLCGFTHACAPLGH